MRRALLLLTLAASLVAFGAPVAAAVPTIVDQSQEEIPNRRVDGVGQTFTPSVTGDLRAFDLKVNKLDVSSVTAEITLIDPWGSPIGSPLASVVVDDMTTGWNTLRFGRVPLVAGTQYALVLRIASPGYLVAEADDRDPYPGGAILVLDHSREVVRWLAVDMVFRTHMSPSADAFAWVSAPTRPRAGGTATYRFSLGGFYGYDVIRGGSPTTTRVTCSTGKPIKGTTFKARPLGGSLTYDAETGRYVLRWKVRPQWAKGALACRTFQVHIRGERDPHVVTVKVRKPAS